MRCTTCGNEAPDGAAHCPSCGTALATGSAPGWGSSEQGSGDQGSGQTGSTPGGWSSPPSTPTPPPAWGTQEQAPPPPAWGQQESAGWGQQGPSNPPPSSPPPGSNPGFGSPSGYGNPSGYGSAGDYGSPGGSGGGYGTPPPAWDGGAAIGSQTGTLAGWWYRVGATVIDGIILGIVDAILHAIGGTGFGYGGSIVIGIVYFGVLFSRYGASVGMMALGTKCVRERDGAFLPIGPAIGRYLLTVLLEITVIGGILDVLWPLWDAKNQTIHDKAVGTLVVRSR